MSPLARRSALVLGLLFGLVFAVGISLMWYFQEPIGYAIAFALTITLLQYVLGPVLIDSIFTIRWAVPEEISPKFAAWFEQTCKELGVPMPRFGIIHDGNPNAFTYGRTRGDARIVITSGLVEMLTPKEMRAVVAHELGHVVNRDFIVMTVAQAVPLVLYVLYIWTRDRGRSFSYGYVVAIGAYTVYILSQFVVLTLSRLREFFADNASARITGDPNSLSKALIKIGYGLARQQELVGRHQVTAKGDKQAQAGSRRSYLTSVGPATLGIASVASAGGYVAALSGADGEFSEAALANAMQWELTNPWAKWYQFNSTHPLIAHRITAMGEAATQLGVTPAYTLQAGASSARYTGNFAKELLIYLLPAMTTLATLALGLSRGNMKTWSMTMGYAAMGFGVGWLVKTLLTYPRLDGALRTIEDLVASEINASPVNPVPCYVEGQIIGRGTPGLLWSSDLVLSDPTGFIRLQYRQPLGFLEVLFGWLKAGEYINRRARIYGWYRRAPVPYIEISHVDIIEGMSGNVRCYYRWGVYLFAPIMVIGGMMWVGLL